MMAGNTPKVTPDLLATMVELLPDVRSLRELAGLTGLRLDTVRREAAPFLAIMKLNGTHPQCGCGRDRFHPYGCASNYQPPAIPPDCVRGHTRAESAVLLARREAVLEMLVDGERFSDIERALGMASKTARKSLRFLSPEQLAQRERRVAERSSASEIKS